MPTVDEKLELFDKIIYNDAVRARDAIRDQLRHDSEQILEGQKAEIKREAALEYQRETLRASNDRDSRISKARISTRITLMKTRNEIIESVLGDLSSRLAQFAGTDDYQAYLMRSVSESIGAVEREARQIAGGAEQGEIVVYLTPGDYDTYAAEIQKLAPGAEVRPGDPGMIGGARVENAGAGIYVDDSLKKKVEGRAEELLAMSGLTIDS
ncbi:MAG: V-type ATP synthase subunit E family protein [Oscillospiraceae bacterium]|nr:V-type ATP synthase subunit E family protein [Oscillospiraceae bacterium]